MARNLSPRLLRRLIDYSPETGVLTWKPRPRWLFTTNRIYLTWNKRFAGEPALSTPSGNGYLVGRIFDSGYLAHRVAFSIHHGYWPDTIDHENGVVSDNRIKNLRDVDQARNNRNKPISSRNTSGYNGVCWDREKSRWVAYIMIDRKRKHLGRFDRIEDAVAARKRADIEFGFHPNHGRAAA